MKRAHQPKEIQQIEKSPRSLHVCCGHINSVQLSTSLVPSTSSILSAIHLSSHSKYVLLAYSPNQSSTFHYGHPRLLAQVQINQVRYESNDVELPMVQSRAFYLHLPMSILQTKGLSGLHIQRIGMYLGQSPTLKPISCLTMQPAHLQSSRRIPRWWTILFTRALYQVAQLILWSRVTISVLRKGKLTCMKARHSRCPGATDLAYLFSVSKTLVP